MNLEFAAEVDKIGIVGTLLDLYQKFIFLHKIIAILSPEIDTKPIFIEMPTKVLVSFGI